MRIGKICDFVAKAKDRYPHIDTIYLEESRSFGETGAKYEVNNHTGEHSHIPDEVWNTNVGVLWLYPDKIVLEYDEKK